MESRKVRDEFGTQKLQVLKYRALLALIKGDNNLGVTNGQIGSL